MTDHMEIRAMRKTFDYDTIRIGEVLGRRDLLIDEALIRACTTAIEGVAEAAASSIRWMRRVASTPSMPGICTSIRMTS